MVNSASQPEDILGDDGGIRRTRTTAVGRKRVPSETAEQTKVYLPGDWLRHMRCRASATWEQWEVRLAADRLRKQRRRAEEMLQQRGFRLKRLRTWQLKQRNSGQPGYSNLLQYLCLQDGRVFILHAQYFLS